MSSSTGVAVYLPLFVIILVIFLQHGEMQRAVLSKIRERKGVLTMSNEIIKKYIGLNCKISIGSFGTNAVGKIVDINENWIEVETKKGKELINADYVQNIKVK